MAAVHWQADELPAPARLRQLLPQARVYSLQVLNSPVLYVLHVPCRLGTDLQSHLGVP